MLNDILEKLAKQLEEDQESESAEEVRKLKEPEQVVDIVLVTLSDTADKLDSLGAHKEADMIDELLKKMASEKDDLYDAKTHNKQTFLPNKGPHKPQDQHHNPDYQETKEHSLSTRYCPNHVGVTLERVGEGEWECGLCGKRVNDRDKGSVSNQTPLATNIPIPSRVFDPREDVINKLNS